MCEGWLCSALTWSVVLVQNGEREEGSVAMSSEGGLGQRRQVVHVVETWAVCVIVARQQQVHMIWGLEGGEENDDLMKYFDLVQNILASVSETGLLSTNHPSKNNNKHR